MYILYTHTRASQDYVPYLVSMQSEPSAERIVERLLDETPTPSVTPKTLYQDPHSDEISNVNPNGQTSFIENRQLLIFIGNLFFLFFGFAKTKKVSFSIV